MYNKQVIGTLIIVGALIGIVCVAAYTQSPTVSAQDDKYVVSQQNAARAEQILQQQRANYAREHAPVVDTETVDQFCVKVGPDIDYRLSKIGELYTQLDGIRGYDPENLFIQYTSKMKEVIDSTNATLTQARKDSCLSPDIKTAKDAYEKDIIKVKLLMSVDLLYQQEMTAAARKMQAERNQ